MSNNDNNRDDDHALFLETLPDGRRALHGPACAKTQAAVARARGEGGSPSTVKCGPALVNSQAYRDNWTGIFGKKTTVGQA